MEVHSLKKIGVQTTTAVLPLREGASSLVHRFLSLSLRLIGRVSSSASGGILATKYLFARIGLSCRV